MSFVKVYLSIVYFCLTHTHKHTLARERERERKLLRFFNSHRSFNTPKSRVRLGWKNAKGKERKKWKKEEGNHSMRRWSAREKER